MQNLGCGTWVPREPALGRSVARLDKYRATLLPTGIIRKKGKGGVGEQETTLLRRPLGLAACCPAQLALITTFVSPSAACPFTCVSPLLPSPTRSHLYASPKASSDPSTLSRSAPSSARSGDFREWPPGGHLGTHLTSLGGWVRIRQAGKRARGSAILTSLLPQVSVCPGAAVYKAVPYPSWRRGHRVS